MTDEYATPAAVEYEHDHGTLNPATDPSTAHPVATEAAYPTSPASATDPTRPVNPDPPAGDAYRATPTPDWSSSTPPVYPAVDDEAAKDRAEKYSDHETIHEDVRSGVAQLRQNSAANLPGTYVHSAIVHFERVLDKLEAGFTKRDDRKKDGEVK